MDKQAIKNKIMDYARKNHGMTFTEIEWIFDECRFNYRGSLSLRYGKSLNVVLWEGWNNEAFEIVLELVTENMIKHSMALRSATLKYIFDGKTLDHPLVKTNVLKYSDLHWCPTEFEAI